MFIKLASYTIINYDFSFLLIIQDYCFIAHKKSFYKLRLLKLRFIYNSLKNQEEVILKSYCLKFFIIIQIAINKIKIF